LDSSGDGAGTYPPPSSGDWVITNETYVGNETIVLTGNLSILPGGSLTLYNVTLKMNASTSGEFRIRVSVSATLKIELSNVTAVTEDGFHNYGFIAVGGSTLTILSSGIHYVGWNMDFATGYGLIINTSQVTIKDSNISHNYAGITIFHVISKTVTIENNTVSWNMRNGITAVGSDVNITGNRVFYNGLIADPTWHVYAGHGISLDDSSTGVVLDNNIDENYWDGLLVYSSANIEIRGNTFLRNLNEGVELYFAADVLFDGNNASETVLYAGLAAWYSDFNTISNNTFFGNGYAGVYLYTSSFNTIWGNVAGGNSYQGISLRFADYNTISNNTLPGNQNNGLYTFGSNGNNISNNAARGSLDYHGFSIEESHGNNLMGNTAQSVSSCGIWMGMSRMNTVMGNNLSSNGWGGVYIRGEFGNSLLMNEIFENQWVGVEIVNSSSNHLYGNNISNNDFGVVLDSANDNTVIWNNFTSNQFQARDDNGINYWDGGYPIGGNYWDDYGGLDFYNGPNQDIPGSDRIGDVPYVIDSDSQDNYPLATPFDPSLPGPPTNVSATLTGSNLENVTITWDLSWNDRPGGAITNYAIYCGKVFDTNGANYTFLSEISAGNSSYLHQFKGHGDPNNFYYFVVANNTFGKTTKGGNQAGKFTRNLKAGTNLLSSPLWLEDMTMDGVLRTVSFEDIWVYDSSGGGNNWKSFSKSKAYDGSLLLDYGMSFWIKVSQESNFTVAGIVAPRTDILLEAGWNLVGYPSPLNRTSAQSFAGVMTIEIEGFDGSSSPYFLKTMGPSDEVVPGYGYWVKVDTPATWVVENF
jgi:parallel beta-helix repeat protein